MNRIPGTIMGGASRIAFVIFTSGVFVERKLRTLRLVSSKAQSYISGKRSSDMSGAYIRFSSARV
jgi:hypothetical protein